MHSPKIPKMKAQGQEDGWFEWYPAGGGGLDFVTNLVRTAEDGEVFWRVFATENARILLSSILLAQTKEEARRPIRIGHGFTVSVDGGRCQLYRRSKIGNQCEPVDTCYNFGASRLMIFLWTSVDDSPSVRMTQPHVEECERRGHIVKRMPIERLVSYLRFDPSIGLALVDAIISWADTDIVAFDGYKIAQNYPLRTALWLAKDSLSDSKAAMFKSGQH
jgi:hypothetical protein